MKSIVGELHHSSQTEFFGFLNMSEIDLLTARNRCGFSTARSESESNYWHLRYTDTTADIR